MFVQVLNLITQYATLVLFHGTGAPVHTLELDVTVCFPLTLLHAMRNHCSAI